MVLNGIYDNHENLDLYIKKVKQNLKVDGINIYVDDFENGDCFYIGLIYIITDTKHNLLYVGSEKQARGQRQKNHIQIAKNRYKTRKKLNKLQKQIVKYKNDLKIFTDEVVEIVVYKTRDILYKREQNYIDLYDTLKKGLNNHRAKVLNYDYYNQTRFYEYNVNNRFFRRYGRELNKFKDIINDDLNISLNYQEFKNILENNKQNLKDFINIFCYNETYEKEEYNILLNYILYEQRLNNIDNNYDDDIYDIYDENFIMVDVINDEETIIETIETYNNTIIIDCI